MQGKQHGIPTRYNGINFRSRLEAKWACFFDLAGWKWEYEPEDFSGYIPDFVLMTHKPIYVEVKPIYSEHDVIEKCQKAKALSDDEDCRVLCLGSTIGYPNSCCYVWDSEVILGWVWGENTDCCWRGSGSERPFSAEVILCKRCRNLSYFLPAGNWDCAFCGEHDSSSGTDAKGEIEEIVKRLWSDATNIVQYDRSKKEAKPPWYYPRPWKIKRTSDGRIEIPYAAPPSSRIKIDIDKINQTSYDFDSPGF